MSELRKCDLCEKVYEPPVNARLKLVRTFFSGEITVRGPFELCPVCVDALNAWIAERKAASDE